MSVSGPGGGGTDSTTINGTISNNITFTFTGGNAGGDLCQWSGSGSISLGGADVGIRETTPGSTLVAIVTESSMVQGITSTMSNRIGDSIHGLASSHQLTPTATGLAYEGGISGLNAGGGVISYGAWVSYSYSDFENDLSTTALDGSRNSVLVGVDFSPWERTVFGLALGYDFSDTDTTFNRGNVESDTYTIVPYFGALLTDTWSVDFSFGYSRVDYDQFRTAPGTTTRITSEASADRWFGAFNLNGVTYYDNWIIGGRLGTMWSKNETENFFESDGTVVAELRTKLGTWSAGGDVAYSYGDFEPFFSATYEHDYSMMEIAVGGTGPQPANDRDDVLVAAGVRYFGSNGISGNLDWTRRVGRSDFDEDIFSLSLRIDF